MNQLATRETQVLNVFNSDSVKNQLSNYLNDNPKKLEAFKSTILKISMSFGMDRCTPESIIKCGLQALSLRLPLEQGQGYIVNYNGVACFDSGYKGWQVLAKRAGFSVIADIVYKCDNYSQSGVGHSRKMIFEPDFTVRNGANDQWAKENLSGVIVSVLDTQINVETNHFVSAEMIFKITGMAPSTQSAKGKKYSPHENWAEQMFCAKAIKQVLTKFAIELDESVELKNAIDIINNSETEQQKVIEPSRDYPQDKFDSFYPKWVELVSTGKQKTMAIISLLNTGHDLSEPQLEQLMLLKEYENQDNEIIDGEIENA